MRKRIDARSHRWYGLLLLGALLLVAILTLSLSLTSCEGNPGDIDPLGSSDIGEELPSDPDSGNGETPVEPETDENGSEVTAPSDSDDSDDPSGAITLPPVITLPSLDSDATDTEEETLPYDPTLHPGNAEDYAGVMIAAVYGTGKNNTDAAVAAGFVQLYNASSRDVSLKGASLYYKSDGASPYDQLVFAEDAVIPAGGYYLVRAEAISGHDSAMAILGIDEYDAEWDVTIDNHEIRLLLAPTGWAIGRDENILLFDDAISVFYASETPSEHVYAVDGMSKNKIAVRTALKDYSGYHTVNLSTRATAELEQVAPRTSDGRVNEVLSCRLNEVNFSKPAGVYDTPFSLQLTASSDYTIYYTTDGSDPTKNGKKYTGSIPLHDSSEMTWGPTIQAWNNTAGGAARPSSSTLPGGYVIKAYATNGTESTPVYTNTYFINSDMAAYGVTVMSISIPLSEMIGSEGFYNNYLLTNSITGGRRRGFAVMEVFDAAGDRVGHSNVELAVSGNGSSGLRMKSLRIYYKGINNETGGMESDLDYDLFGGLAKDQHGQAITTFDRLLLRNSGNDCGNSYIRDAYMQRVSAGTYVDTMATATTLVFINGEFWGVYNIRERYSPEYAESHYGVDKENVAVIESDYSQVHSNHMADYVVSSGIEGDADDFNDLTSFMRNNDLSDPAVYAQVCERLDINSFIDMWVIRLFFNARDWPENNVKVWRNRNPDDPSGFDTKWRFTLLDMDMGLAFFPWNDVNNTAENANFFYGFISHSGSVCAQMMRDLLENQSFRDQFIVRYYELVKERFTPEYLSAVFEDMVAERDSLMSLQVARWPGDGASISTWNSDVSDIRSFIANRQQYALSYLYSFFGITEEEIENMSVRRVGISFHPDRADVTVNGSAVVDGTQFRFEDESYTFTVSATAREGYTLTAIVWTSRDGTTQRVEGNTATFTVSTTGTISVYTKRNQTGDTVTGGSLVAGATYMFYLTESGDLYAWGDNRGGVLGLGVTSVTVPDPTFVMGNVAKVATTQAAAYENGDLVWMTAILTKDGKLYTVGINNCGQLGRNGTTDATTLGEVSFRSTIVDVSVGYDHMLILDDQGQMWGIGSNTNGQLGTSGQGGTKQTFVKIASNVTQISAGRRSTAYIDENGDLWGLGDNRWKKLSQSHGDVITTPVKMLSNVAYVGSSEHQLVAVTESGDLYYAGWRDFNSFVQDGGNNPTMRKVMSGAKKADVYCNNMVVLTESGDAYVYGLNTDGGIGTSAVTGGTPKKIYSGVADVTAGYGFTAYLCDDGYIRVLGDNTYGQAGNGRSGGKVNFSEADV